MGTAEFAVPSLKALVEAQYNVVAVITATDKKKGRGQKLAYSPVKEYAVEKDISVLQPTNLKDAEFIEELKSYKANLQVVVAFRMLPEIVWNMPELGTFNLHASLLPNYRGAAPINWAIINGEKETGVTTFFLKQEIDTGAIILQEKEPISYDDNVGTLYERLMIKGSKLVIDTVAQIQDGSVESQPQSEESAMNPAPKIFKETCQIDWNKPFEEVRNFIRGLNPYPAAWTILDKKTCKVFNVLKSDYPENAGAGQFRTDSNQLILVRCADSWVSITDLQMEGKKRMQTSDFLRGNKLNIPEIK